MATDRSFYSDLHKDAYGFRPHGWHWDRAMEMSDSEFEAHCDSLCDMVRFNDEYRERCEVAALGEFEALLDRMTREHGITTRDAIRWLMQAEGRRDDPQALEMMLYGYGLGFDDMRAYAEIVTGRN